MPLRHSRYRRTGTQCLFNDSSLLFDRSPLSLYASISLYRPLLGSVHLSLVDTYRCAHFGQLPCLLTLSPDGSDQSLTFSIKKQIHICALIIAVTLCGCDGGTRITGVVFDSEGRPVADAGIKLTCGAYSREVKTTDYGFFKIGMTHSPWNPELTLAVEKEG